MSNADVRINPTRPEECLYSTKTNEWCDYLKPYGARHSPFYWLCTKYAYTAMRRSKYGCPLRCAQCRRKST